MKIASIAALLFGPDRPGLVARTAGWIFEHGGNILHADQHRDAEENVFFQRLEWTPLDNTSSLTAQAQEFSAFATKELGMNCRAIRTDEKRRVGVLVSRTPHCLHDLVFRFRSGQMRGEIVCVISNQPVVEEFCRSVDLPFHLVEVSPRNKEQAEERQLEIFRHYQVRLIVLARYMQVLSASFLERVGVPVINIHHSFLPAFAGGRPYHQAYARGVKLIGATGHYATADLDQGPIIAQDVAYVTHRHTVDDLIRKGQDLERVVFAQAVRLHLEQRVLVYKNKTVVFD